jgi:hypothetical protein
MLRILEAIKIIRFDMLLSAKIAVEYVAGRSQEEWVTKVLYFLRVAIASL